MRVGPPEVAVRDGVVRWSCLVTGARADELWFAVDARYRDLISDRMDAALIGLLLPAMVEGGEFEIEGVISDRLLYISPRLQRALQILLPRLHTVALRPTASRRTMGDRPPGVVTGFSGGVDSNCAVADHLDGIKLTHLLFNNVGSHGDGGERLFQERFNRLTLAADSLGLPLIRVDSNLDEFYDRGVIPFIKSHTLRNAAVALLLGKGVRRYLYASGPKIQDTRVSSEVDIGFADPVILPMLSTGSLEMLSVGGEYTRVEKTVIVSDFGEAHKHLDVCVTPDGLGESPTEGGPANCGHCFKCLRTLLTLEIAGRLDRFSGSCDLTAYQAARTDFLAEVLASDDVWLTEIRDFAKVQAFEFPAAAHLIHKFRLKRPIRKFRHLRGRYFG